VIDPERESFASRQCANGIVRKMKARRARPRQTTNANMPRLRIEVLVLDLEGF